MSNPETLNIRHEPGNQRFVADAGAHEGVLDYRVLRPGVLDYRRTFVPPAARGRGVATRLVKHALDHARSHDLRVVPSCSFVDAYMRGHPEYETLRAKDA